LDMALVTSIHSVSLKKKPQGRARQILNEEAEFA
jgi:hypothetical protein